MAGPRAPNGTELKRMQSVWPRRVAYLVLAALVAVTSCRAWNAPPASAAASLTVPATSPAPEAGG